uniref:Alpha-galactosidase n=1 Tax=Acidobacterium capsulatum TaxID=33075 RepID=A0A7V4XSA7_9BACT
MRMKAVSQKALRCAVVLAVALVTVVALPAQSKPYPTAAHLAPTPPMGWNSWNHFAGKVDEADVRAAAKAMVDSGMAAAGYKYIVIDDTWQGKRDAQGFIHPNSKFPDMPGLIQYVHSLGLKFGIYSSPGPQTCAGYEGSYGHVQQDAETYARWGVDYLKYDLCSYLGIMHKEAANNPAKALAMQQAAYLKMYKALAAAGRPIVFSLCQYGIGDVWKWGPSVGGNLWRTTGDIKDNYARMAQIGFGQAGLAKYAGPGHWNDPDMLEVGNGGMTNEEYRTHMSLWAILAAPLIAGNDLSHMSPATLAILTNREVIAVDQDRLGREGDRVSKNGLLEIWAKPLTGGAKAVGLFNRDTQPHSMTLQLSAVNFPPHAHLRDLWRQKTVHAHHGAYTVTVPAHGVVLLKLTR